MKLLSQKLLFFSLILTGFASQAQVGVGTTTPQGAMDITSTTDGLLVPRVALVNTTTATVSTPTTSEIVYNTATINDVTPGFYYWSGTQWIRIATGNSSDWSLTGNGGTAAGTNFIGTTDAQDLRFKTNSTDRLNISNTTGQIQTYASGAAGTPAFTWNSDTNTGIFRPAADNISLTTNGVEGVRLRNNSNLTVGATYATANAAPTSGLRIEGQTVVGKASGEDSRDKISAHTSATAYQNITGYPNSTANRAVSGYADSNGIGLFGFANRTGYGVVGLTQPSTISNFVQTGEGVLGQTDGATGGPTIPLGVHGIIHETTTGTWRATGTAGENNNVTPGVGFSGGPYTASGVTCGSYGNYASIGISSGTNMYAFGVAGDLLTLGGSIPDGAGGVFGSGGSGQFGMLGYNSLAGTRYSVYGGGANDDIATGNTGKSGSESTSPNNHVGLGINGGFMGGYVKGNQYGMISSGKEFGIYVQGNTIVNQPVVQLSEGNGAERTKMYLASSTEVDITTRGVGQLSNGEAFISFKQAFKNNVSKSEAINVTVTPTQETNGVYVSKVTAEGFYIKENRNGNSNASFNWTAIGTRAGFENGVEISNTVLSNNFDEKMNGVMQDDGTKKEGTPIYYDGQNVRFERIPEGFVKSQKKESPKKK
ncbi:hypothetical protein [Flavobacterium pedocola]